jgi:hypothetical protein
MEIKIKKLITISGLCLAAVVALASCSKEESPTPVYKNPSASFLPDGNDTSEEAQLRRTFFSETGSYLLFNDTIQRQVLGIDINGQERSFIETIDFTYNVGQSSSMNSFFRFTLLQTFEQKQMVTNFMNEYILPHLTGKLRPFSWFLCNVITSYSDSYSAPSKPYSVSCQRCIGVAGNYLILRDRTDTQKQQYAQRILNGIIGQLATNNSNAFGDFFKYSANYYSADYSRFGYTDRPSQADLYRMGFISSTGISSFPSMATDLGIYALLVIQYTDEQLTQQYGSYPIILDKATVVRRILTELGYVF